MLLRTPRKLQHLRRLADACEHHPHALRGLTQGVVVQLRISHRGLRLSMAKQAPDDGQTLLRTRKDDRHNELVQVMYSDPANELQLIELERARLDLEQQKTELMAAKAEATQTNKDALADMAAAGIDVHQANRDQVSRMAARELGRRKKT